MIAWAAALLEDDTGAALPEYAMLLALLSMLSIASLATIATLTESTLEAAYTHFEQLQETPPQ
ncbi:MAG TPA: hypothetical protein VIG32_07795 [Candidatus Baltobacteraceae bacterium]|jgi:Flp pilus assembly pilin Flp